MNWETENEAQSITNFLVKKNQNQPRTKKYTALHHHIHTTILNMEEHVNICW
jgi:hypothetical protein